MAVLALVPVVAGCSATTGATGRPPRTTAAVRETTTVATNPTTTIVRSLSPLPDPHQPGDAVGDKVLITGHGKGDRNLGTVDETGHELYLQVSCLGPGGINFRNLTAVGPCDGSVATMTMPWTKPLGVVAIDVQASPSTVWAVYVSQH